MSIENLKHERRELAKALSSGSHETDGWQYSAKEFAYNLVGWMLKRGMSHGDLSREAGIHPATLTRIIHGNYDFGTTVMVRLSSALNVPVRDFFRKPRIRKEPVAADRLRSDGRIFSGRKSGMRRCPTTDAPLDRWLEEASVAAHSLYRR